jgi:hypothetical protein
MHLKFFAWFTENFHFAYSPNALIELNLALPQ